MIYLVPESLAVLNHLVKKHPEGALFRNAKGRPWTKDAIKCRLTRISEKVGFRVIAYGARHSWATQALTEGGVDPISVAHLMGHRDPTMVSRVYSHLSRNPLSSAAGQQRNSKARCLLIALVQGFELRNQSFSKCLAPLLQAVYCRFYGSLGIRRTSE